MTNHVTICDSLLQVPDLDVIVVSVGGGGMISGICVAAKVSDIIIIIVIIRLLYRGLIQLLK